MWIRHKREIIAHELGHVTRSGPHCITVWEDSKGTWQGECIAPGIMTDAEVIDSICGALAADYVMEYGKRGKITDIVRHGKNSHDVQILTKHLSEWRGGDDDLAMIVTRGIKRGSDIGMMFRDVLDDTVIQFIMADCFTHSSYIVDLSAGLEPQYTQTREEFCATNGVPCIPLHFYEIYASQTH